MDIAKTQQIHFIALMSFCGQGIAEKEQEVDFIASDQGSDLLISALRAAQKSFDIQSRSFGNQFAGSAGRAKIMSAQNTAVSNAELYPGLTMQRR